MKGRAIFHSDYLIFPKHSLVAGYSRITNLDSLSGNNLKYINLFDIEYRFNKNHKVNFSGLTLHVKGNENFGRASAEALFNLKTINF
ncbi:MAG: hypothetical protein HC906_01875 [Bacteroidales bacterium]|nr:hypothetical protein [Bacteroidales bacterium]